MQWSLRSGPARTAAADPGGRCGHGQGLLLLEYVALLTEVCLVHADSFVPAHDWCRLPVSVGRHHLSPVSVGRHLSPVSVGRHLSLVSVGS